MVDPKMFQTEPSRLGRLVIHELVHVRQFNEQGYFPFMTRYIVESLRGRLAGKSARDAYLDISTEQEAREVAQRLSGSI